MVSEPTDSSQIASYNTLNQLTNLSGQALSFDANGNLVSDGVRTYSWDAENRLVQIGYQSQPGKQTSFAYDGLGRRTAITSTPAGSGGVTTNYVWCGSVICQARNASGTATRGYYSEGEFVPGGSGQGYYYGIDQLGSVRRVFVSPSSAPAYDYDPYGSALSSITQLTDFGYAGTFYNLDSDLDLAINRVYDPSVGRWLSRDPLQYDKTNNLYEYSNDDPIFGRDPSGLYTVSIGFSISTIFGGGGTASAGFYYTSSSQYGTPDVGIYSSSGPGSGVDVSGNVTASYTPGSVSNFSSPNSTTSTTTFGSGPASLGVSDNGAITANLGGGLPVTAAETDTTTRTQGGGRRLHWPVIQSARKSLAPTLSGRWPMSRSLEWSSSTA